MRRISLQSHSTICIFTRSHKKMWVPYVTGTPKMSQIGSLIVELPIYVFVVICLLFQTLPVGDRVAACLSSPTCWSVWRGGRRSPTTTTAATAVSEGASGIPSTPSIGTVASAGNVTPERQCPRPALVRTQLGVIQADAGVYGYSRGDRMPSFARVCPRMPDHWSRTLDSIVGTLPSHSGPEWNQNAPCHFSSQLLTSQLLTFAFLLICLTVNFVRFITSNV